MSWVYRYIRADLEEVDVGPFDTKEEVERKSDEHSRFGAIVSAPIEIDDE